MAKAVKRPDTGKPEEEQSPGDNQLFDKKAERYIRDAGKIEDMPEPGEEKDPNDDDINKESGDDPDNHREAISQ